MTSRAIADLVEIALLGWFACMAAIVLVQIATGRIVLIGLLRHEGAASGFHFHRLQLLATTMLFVGHYAFEALGKGPGSALPDISNTVLAMLVGSNSLYIGGKFATR